MQTIERLIPESPARERRSRPLVLAEVALIGITLAAFGPYTPVAGIRTEQVAVYGVAAVLVISTRWIQRSWTGTVRILCILMGVEIAVSVIGTVAPPNILGIVQREAFAGLDNLFLPIVVLFIVWTLRDDVDQRRMVDTICRIVIVAMCANTVLAYVSQFHDLTPFLSRFWNNAPVGSRTVAGNSETMGRYTGIFNQPPEAGELYSIALLAAIYLYRRRTVMFAVTSLLIAVGGILTISKVFLLVGLPIGVWQMVRQHRGRARRLLLVAVAVVGVAAAQNALGQQWQGASYLLRLIHPGESNGDLVGFYSAGRLGSAGTLHNVVTTVMHASPAFGLGARGLIAPYDNGWVEALCMAGLIGVAVYTAILAVLAGAYGRLRALLDPAESRLAGGLVLLVIGTSVGLPALTANRDATIVWLFFGLLLLGSPKERPTSDLYELVFRDASQLLHHGDP